jgi:hypothetical protein
MVRNLTVLMEEDLQKRNLNLQDGNRFTQMRVDRSNILFSFYEPNRTLAEKAAKKAIKKYGDNGSDFVVARLDSSATVGFWTSAEYVIEQYRLR